MPGPVTTVARVEDVQIFLKDPVYPRLPRGFQVLHLKRYAYPVYHVRATCPPITPVSIFFCPNYKQVSQIKDLKNFPTNLFRIHFA